MIEKGIVFPQFIPLTNTHALVLLTLLKAWGSIGTSRTRSEGHWMKLIDPLKPFAEESGFSNTLEGYLKNTVSVLELFKAAQSYPHASALKKQCLWTKHYLEMELSNSPITSVRDQYLKREVEDALSFPHYASLERLDHRRKLLRGSCVEKNTRVMKTSYCSDILKLAVEDFNFCQSIHGEEMKRLDSLQDRSWLTVTSLVLQPFSLQSYLHAPAEACGEGNGVGGEVDVVREEDDVVVGVGVSLRKELLRRETIFERRHLEGRERGGGD
ncbi:hypothetical protein F2Q69_00051886 [Brassica cretica]|uniref:Uncharacterized protein n=1 Tax=Brassica cretica TaxID=69181 RepID=A0A8S9PG18_BRACR|nr:hypothetical protein F2Q69_00051886 [Brassica cretica]